MVFFGYLERLPKTATVYALPRGSRDLLGLATPFVEAGRN